MILATRIYEIEMWSRTGVLLADISSLAKNLKFSMQRNEAEELTLTIDLNAYEELSASIGTNPMSMLLPYVTDIKVKRNGTYLFGTHVVETNSSLDENDQTIEIRARGYLDLLVDRYVTKTYTNEYETDILWDLIDTTQSQTNGDMGITQGAQQVQLVQRDRLYERQNVKDAIVNLTKLQSGNFDIQFLHTREFNTYEMMGSDRSATLRFVYPGNVKQMFVPRTGLAIANKIYGIGAGFGEDQITSTPTDNDSQLNYGVHEKIVTWNSVLEQATLDENAQAYLDSVKGLLEIPQMVVSGADFSLNDYGIGDRVTARVDDHPFLNTINGVYRIERLDVDVDENESEDIRIYFDDNQLELEDA